MKLAINYTKVKGGVRPACHRRPDHRPWVVCRRCLLAYPVYAPGADVWVQHHSKCKKPAAFWYKGDDPVRVYSNKRVEREAKKGHWRKDITPLELLAAAGLE